MLERRHASIVVPSHCRISAARKSAVRCRGGTLVRPDADIPGNWRTSARTRSLGSGTAIPDPSPRAERLAAELGLAPERKHLEPHGDAALEDAVAGFRHRGTVLGPLGPQSSVAANLEIDGTLYLIGSRGTRRGCMPRRNLNSCRMAESRRARDAAANP